MHSPIKLNKNLTLSYEPKGNLSVCTATFYSGFTGRNKKILATRDGLPHQKCPFCPRIFGSKLPTEGLGFQIGQFLIKRFRGIF